MMFHCLGNGISNSGTVSHLVTQTRATSLLLGFTGRIVKYRHPAHHRAHKRKRGQ